MPGTPREVPTPGATAETREVPTHTRSVIRWGVDHATHGQHPTRCAGRNAWGVSQPPHGQVPTQRPVIAAWGVCRVPTGSPLESPPFSRLAEAAARAAALRAPVTRGVLRHPPQLD